MVYVILIPSFLFEQKVLFSEKNELQDPSSYFLTLYCHVFFNSTKNSS
jgi:hypothetical protein